MKIVIVGCGRVGSMLANMLSSEGHEISIIDKNPLSFARLGKSFKGDAIEGSGFDKKILEKAGIERSDAFASVTNGDNTNIVSALVAKRKYRVPIVITRIYDPARAEIYRRLGLTTISSTTWGATTIKDMILHPGLLEKITLGSGEAKIIEVTALHQLIGHSIAELSIPSEISVIAIIRAGKAFIPTAGTRLEEGDILYIVVLSSASPKLKKMLEVA
jgi:trk system potassium uptake protein TrkA